MTKKSAHFIVLAVLCIAWFGGCNCKNERNASSRKTPKSSGIHSTASNQERRNATFGMNAALDNKLKKSSVPAPKGMVFIPEGKFPMGCNMVDHDYCRGDEVPQRIVNVSGFFIDKYEVSVAEYQECVGAGKCKKPDSFLKGDDYRGYCNFGRSGYESHPVNCLSWKQASEFCTWANKRLLSEAEWERAARGSQGRIYPWGDSPEPNCEYATMYDAITKEEGCGLKGTKTVDSNEKGATSEGVVNLLGNIAEWIADRYMPNSYATLPDLNPRQDKTGKNRVTRGGSFTSNASLLRNSKRHWIDPDSGYRGIGVRCGKSVDAQ